MFDWIIFFFFTRLCRLQRTPTESKKKSFTAKVGIFSVGKTSTRIQKSTLLKKVTNWRKIYTERFHIDQMFTQPSWAVSISTVQTFYEALICLVWRNLFRVTRNMYLLYISVLLFIKKYIYWYNTLYRLVRITLFAQYSGNAYMNIVSLIYRVPDCFAGKFPTVSFFYYWNHFKIEIYCIQLYY